MKKWALHFLISVLFLFCSMGATALENPLTGARSAALAHATVALPGSEAIFHNPSALAFEDRLSLILSYESRFLLKELSLMSAGIVFPTPTGTFGGSIVRFEAGIYHEDRIGLCFTKKLGALISASVGFDYLSEALPENERSFHTCTMEAGITAGKPGKILAGLHIFNPALIQLKLPGEKVTVPWSVRLGNTWYVSEWVLFCSELDIVQKKDVGFRTGLEFCPHPRISIRTGISGRPFQISMGTGFQMGRMVFDIAFIHHGNLGFSPIAGIRFSL